MIFFNRTKNDYFIISATNQEIKIWNKNGENINTYNIEKDYPIFLNKFYNEFRCYLIYMNKKLTVRDIESGEIIHEYGEENEKGHYHWAEVSFLYDKKRIIGAHYDDGFIKIYDFDTEKLVKKFSYEKNEYNFSFCLWNEKYIIVGYIYSLKIFNIEEGILVKEINSLFSGWGILTIFKFYHSSLEDCLICNCHSGASDEGGKICLLTIK